MLSENHFYARVFDPQIRCIFFDVGTTLIDESEAYNHRIRNAIKGTDITFEQFKAKLIEFQKQNKKGDLAALEFFGLAKPAWHREDEKPYPDALDILKYLKEKGYQIGIIANQSPGTADRLKNWGLLPYIDLVFASAEMGMAKPDPRIFIEALRQSGCIPAETVMIGDRFDNDIMPEKMLGMHTVWAKQGNTKYCTPTSEADTPEYTVEKLAELKDIF